MQLSQLTEGLGARSTLPGADPLIRGITYDSRCVAPGDLFVALRGAQADGHDYLRQAASLGAVALLVEQAPADPSLPPAAVVSDTRRALAPLAVRFFGAPGEELTLVGVTGTNGKTSTTFLIDSMLRAAGIPAGLIGTVEVRGPGLRRRARNTTPESLDLQRSLRALHTKGARTVAMEVSSHGLALGRVAGCRFAVGAITNLSQDHLDFHDGMEDYAEAKALLFREHLTPSGAAVINVDDPQAPRFLNAASQSGAQVLRVSRDPAAQAEVRVLEAQSCIAGTRARLAAPGGELSLSLPLPGDFNLENLAVAVGVAAALELPRDAIEQGASQCPQVPGRVERIGAELPETPTVLVDYAHTPDALVNLLRALRPLCQGRLFTVFGCGGDRDRGKRPLMAEAVARFSDLAIATSDNPRSEDPQRILDDIAAGLGALRRMAPEQIEAGQFRRQSGRAWCAVVDRRAAIALAIHSAEAADTVVIAGKGHEDYQVIGREMRPFDDRREARRALQERA